MTGEAEGVAGRRRAWVRHARFTAWLCPAWHVPAAGKTPGALDLVFSSVRGVGEGGTLETRFMKFRALCLARGSSHSHRRMNGVSNQHMLRRAARKEGDRGRCR